MNDPLFTAKNISLQFSVGDETTTAVKEASIIVPNQSITIIYGASGSGKSSLLNVISGLQPPTKGTLFYKHENIYDKPSNALAYFRAHELGIVYQTNYWVKSLTVLDNVSLPLYFSGLTKPQAHELAKKSLDRVGMLSYINKHPALLSGGEQQRVAMARALVNDPPVIIADEPTGNLDSKNGDMIIQLLTDLHKNEGKTIILVTHNMEYLTIADHLLEVEDGNVTQISQKQIPSTVEEILKTTQDRMHKLIGKNRS